MANFKIIDSIKDIGPLVADLAVSGELGLDVETSGLDSISCVLYTIQLYINNNTYVVNCLNFKEVPYLVQLLSSKKVIGHNIKYDVKVLHAKTGELLPIVFDTMSAEIMINQGVGKKMYSLAELVLKYEGVELDKTVRASFYESKEILTSLTYDQLLYAANDVAYLLPIYRKQTEKLESQNQQNVVDLEMRLIPAISKMENTGVYLDRELWLDLMQEAVGKAAVIGEDIKDQIIAKLKLDGSKTLLQVLDSLSISVTTKRDKTAFELLPADASTIPFIRDKVNLASPKQMLAILRLFGIKTDSTGEKLLKDKFGNKPIVKSLLELREYIKKSTSFGQSFLDKINPVTGRIHAEFNQLRADTGRFSCSEPNLQQIVRDSHYRSCFRARPGRKLLTADYSQQELRLAGSISGEPKFEEAYLKGIDMHTLTASIIFDEPLESVVPEQRQVAKGYNFAVLYGSTEYGLAYNFQMDIKRAKILLDKFFAGYSRLAFFKQQVEKAIVERGYSSTPLGRKRFFEKKTMYSSYDEKEKIENAIKRQGFNHIVQGAGADVTKLALVTMHEKNPFGDRFLILMTVHDEIVAEVDEGILKEAQEFMENCMLEAERPFLGRIPAEVSCKVGDVWSK